MPSIAGLAAGPPQPVHITGFGQTMNVFNSKQRPIKLTIYGDDFRCGLGRTGNWHQAFKTCTLGRTEDMADCETQLAITSALFIHCWCRPGQLYR